MGKGFLQAEPEPIKCACLDCSDLFKQNYYVSNFHGRSNSGLVWADRPGPNDCNDGLGGNDGVGGNGGPRGNDGPGGNDGTGGNDGPGDNDGALLGMPLSSSCRHLEHQTPIVQSNNPEHQRFLLRLYKVAPPQPNPDQALRLHSERSFPFKSIITSFQSYLHFHTV
jgi:hypothetical protein